MHGGHDDAKAVDVGHLGEAQVLFVHLAVDRIERLLASGDAHIHAGRLERGFDLALHLLDQVAAAIARLGHGLAENRVAPRAQVAGTPVPAARDRSGSGPADARSARRSPASRDEMRAHFSRGTSSSVRMLWVRSASLIRITRTSRAMASSILRNDSAWFSSRVLNCSLSSLVRPSTSSATGAPKRSISCGLGDAAVLDRVVQQRRHQGLGVELPFGALRGDGDRMGDVGLAAGADLAQVGFVGEAVGLANLVGFGRFQVVEPGRERGKAGRRRVGCRGAGLGRRRRTLAFAG